MATKDEYRIQQVTTGYSTMFIVEQKKWVRNRWLSKKPSGYYWSNCISGGASGRWASFATLEEAKEALHKHINRPEDSAQTVYTFTA